MYIVSMSNNRKTLAKITNDKMTPCDKVYCVKCKCFVTREERDYICNFECFTGSCKKTVEQLVPSYKKCYTIYQYDRDKYGRIYKKLQKAAIKLNDASIFHRVSPYRILDLCYIRDDDGNPKNLWFEDATHRRIALDRIMSEIARAILLKYNNAPTENDLKELFINTGVAIYVRQDYIQAEIYDLINASMKDRIHNHFLLFRYLKCGCTVQEAMRYVNISIHKKRGLTKKDYSQYVDTITFLDKQIDEVGEEIEPKKYITMKNFKGNMQLLDFFREMTDKYTAFYKKEIREEFCRRFHCSKTFYTEKFEDLLEEVTEQASFVGLKMFCDSRFLYLAFEPYEAKFMENFKSDKRRGLI